MPDPLDYLTKKNQQIADQFRSQYPELFSKIQQENLLESDVAPLPEKKIAPEKNTAEKKWLTQFSFEEHQSIIQKMQDIVRLPAGTLDTELELYLEQQLSDMLGFAVTSELAGQRLQHSHGTLKSVPHQKRYPTDSISEHADVLEAGFSPKRSFFGWINPSYSKEEIVQLEKYSVSLPFFSMSEWSEQQQKLKTWYRYRKVVVINPTESRVVVAAITDIFTHTSNKYQFGGSPELIRSGKFWSPPSNGKALLFFVADEDEQVSLGPIDVGYIKNV